jgi:hypothetical protein
MAVSEEILGSEVEMVLGSESLSCSKVEEIKAESIYIFLCLIIVYSNCLSYLSQLLERLLVHLISICRFIIAEPG